MDTCDIQLDELFLSERYWVINKKGKKNIDQYLNDVLSIPDTDGDKT